MIQVLFYGDRLDDGTRELLEIFDFTKNARMTARMYKNIVYELEYIRDYNTERKYAKALVFSDDKIVLTVETSLFDFDDEDMILTSINQVTQRCYSRKHLNPAHNPGPLPVRGYKGGLIQALLL